MNKALTPLLLIYSKFGSFLRRHKSRLLRRASGGTAQQEQRQQKHTFSEPIALYRVRHRSASEGRGGDIVALGLYVHSGAEDCTEQQSQPILGEATRIKTHQGSAPLGMSIKYVGLWKGETRTRILRMPSDWSWKKLRASKAVSEVWIEHLRRL